MIYINGNTDKLDIEKSLDEVSVQRREMALKFRNDNNKRLSLAAYLLLKEGLEKEYSITGKPVIEYTKSGKPFLPEYPEIHFSLSHSGTVALCAISDRPIGADVEMYRKISEGLIDYTMNDSEKCKILSSNDLQLEFLRFWTQKEAVLKLTGEGIVQSLKNVLTETGKYCIETCSCENYVYSVAKFNNKSKKTGNSL